MMKPAPNHRRQRTVRHLALMDNAIYTMGAFTLPLITNVLVLVYAFIGFRRTRQGVFLLWLLISVLGFVATFAGSYGLCAVF